jgi:hypothetical protein
MDKCPACGSPRLYPSRARSPFERLQRVLRRKRPYRCHACDWRQWIDVPPPPKHAETSPDDLRSGHDSRPIASAELDGLDPQ